jgi:hypothetical protein
MRFATLLAILLAGGASAGAPPPPITVCASGCDFSMIQDAVAAAVSGTTIDVGPGTYAENVTVNEVSSRKKFRLTIEGTDAGSTIVDGSNASSVFTIVGSKAIVTLRGMTIRNGLAPGTGTVTPTEGGGVFAGLGAGVTIDGCLVSRNRADHGAGIAADDAELTISRSTVSDNTSIGAVYVPEGGGIFFSSTKHRKMLIVDSVISRNVASYGGGVDVSVNGPRLLTSDATIAGTTISFNDAGIPQGSVAILTQGGGIFVGAAKLEVINSTISNNTSSGPGGETAGIGNHQGEVTLNNVTIADNIAIGTTGGVEAGTKTTLSNTILADNGDASGESDCSGGARLEGLQRSPRHEVHLQRQDRPRHHRVGSHARAAHGQWRHPGAVCTARDTGAVGPSDLRCRQSGDTQRQERSLRAGGRDRPAQSRACRRPLRRRRVSNAAGVR